MTLNQGSGFAGTGERKEMKGHSTRAEAAPAQGGGTKRTLNPRSGSAGAGGRKKGRDTELARRLCRRRGAKKRGATSKLRNNGCAGAGGMATRSDT